MSDKNKTQDLKTAGLFGSANEDSLEFTPITEGLGFQDTVSDGTYTEEVKVEVTEEVTGSSSDAGVLDIGIEESDNGVLDISGEKIRIQTAETLSPILFHSGHDGLIKKSAKKTKESFFSVFIDSLISLSLAICVMAVFSDQLNINLAETFTRQATLNFINIFVAVFLVYRVFSRTFYFRSIGEWACRHQMGDSDDQEKVHYPALVFFREVFTVLTGLFSFSILSAVFNKDIGALFSGVHTFLEHKK